MHSLTYGGKDRVFGNDRVFDIGTIRLFLQQVEHGKALVLYTLMPGWDERRQQSGDALHFGAT
jgi:hypothetical protein